MGGAAEVQGTAGPEGRRGALTASAALINDDKTQKKKTEVGRGRVLKYVCAEASRPLIKPLVRLLLRASEPRRVSFMFWWRRRAPRKTGIKLNKCVSGSKQGSPVLLEG